ncbi:MAG: DUF4404 family protein [bacterium]|nr:DUF4404 family protein [bacterium]
MTEREELRRSLDRLRDEISHLEDSDEATRRRMNRLVAQLEDQLGGEAEEEHLGMLTEAVRNYVEQLEIEHPRMTSVLNRILVGLSNIGI